MQYSIEGEALPVVICHLEAGERMITEGDVSEYENGDVQ